MELDPKLSEQSRCGQNDQTENQGATLIEYVLLLALVTLLCLGAMQIVGTRVSQRFSRLASVMETAP